MSSEIPATEKYRRLFTSRCKHRKTIAEHPACFLGSSTLRSFKKEEPNLKKVDEKKQLIEIQKLGDGLLQRLSNRNCFIKAPPFKRDFPGKVEEYACLVLSDVHYGKRNWFGALEEKSEETYNTDICVKEMNRLLESISDINTYLCGKYDFKKLYVFMVGDLLDNEVIVKGQQWFVDVGVGMQLINGIDVFQQLFKQLLTMFPEVDVTLIGGNHGRMQHERMEAPFYNNFDYLLGRMLKKAFEKEKRITFTLPESWFYVKQIWDWKYALHHGNTVYSWLSMPYYGLQRIGKARRIEIPVDLEIIGHFHQAMEMSYDF